MKKHFALPLILLSGIVAHAGDFAGNIDLQGAEVSDALNTYTKFSGLELKIDKNVNLRTPLYIHANFTNKLQGASILATNLQTQANIIITPLDDKHASVKMVVK